MLRKLKAQVHIGKAALALDDESYRILLHAATGKTSSADMTEHELRTVLQRLRDRGWKNQRSSPASRQRDSKDQLDKIRALWITLNQSGALRDGSEQALTSFARRMTGVARIDWLRSNQANTVIEALKKWQARHNAEDALCN